MCKWVHPFFIFGSSNSTFKQFSYWTKHWNDGWNERIFVIFQDRKINQSYKWINMFSEKYENIDKTVDGKHVRLHSFLWFMLIWVLFLVK